MNSPALRGSDKRTYPKRGARQSRPRTSTGSRRGRGHAVASYTASSAGVATTAKKWTKVWRNPTSPLDEPYFGSSPKASFQVPTWVKLDELTPEERTLYNEHQRKKEQERESWKKEMERALEEKDKEAREKREQERRGQKQKGYGTTADENQGDRDESDSVEDGNDENNDQADVAIESGGLSGKGNSIHENDVQTSFLNDEINERNHNGIKAYPEKYSYQNAVNATEKSTTLFTSTGENFLPSSIAEGETEFEHTIDENTKSEQKGIGRNIEPLHENEVTPQDRTT